VSARSHTAADRTGGRVQNRQRTIFAVTYENKDKDENADLLQRVAQLEQQLKQATQGGPATLGVLLKSQTPNVAEVRNPLIKTV